MMGKMIDAAKEFESNSGIMIRMIEVTLPRVAFDDLWESPIVDLRHEYQNGEAFLVSRRFTFRRGPS